MDTATWDTFKRSNARRGRRSEALKVDPLKSFDAKLAAKRKEISVDPFVKELVEKVLSFLALPETDLLSYGIGSILESPVSQYQYAVFLQIKESASWNFVGSYDPVSSEDEVQRMSLEGIKIAHFPHSLNGAESKSCFFYMPHCESQTYTELLMDIKDSGIVAKLLLFGSDLKAYKSEALQKVLQSFQLEKHTMFTEFGPRPDVFNDCYLQELTLIQNEKIE